MKSLNGYNTPKHSLSEIEDALRRSKGLISYAARSLGMTYEAIYRRVKRSERLQRVLKEAREELVDHAEYGLHDEVKKKRPWAINLTLKTLGKDRGFVERTEIEETAVVKVKLIPREKK